MTQIGKSNVKTEHRIEDNGHEATQPEATRNAVSHQELDKVSAVLPQSFGAARRGPR